ncbi:hypothetical protein BD779DRAFT_1675609 [Infundibulicybe gibba]|nr:hypothetical protein BD779DRAFT_1675609 [Infundibulicybe gibba]
MQDIELGESTPPMSSTSASLPSSSRPFSISPSPQPPAGQSKGKKSTLPRSKSLETILAYHGVKINHRDLRRLQRPQFLNCELIQFGLRYYLKELGLCMPELAGQFHLFTTYFYSKLITKDNQINYSAVECWTAKVNIFQKKYIIIPINQSLHWFLVIICNPGSMVCFPPPTPSTSGQVVDGGKSNEKTEPLHTYILTLDSMNWGHPSVVTNLTQYLRKEAAAKGLRWRGSACPQAKKAMVPSQGNSYDCGVYLLHFAKVFMSDPEKYYGLIMSRKELNEKEQAEEWKSQGVSNIRERLKRMINSLSARWMAEEGKQKEDC